MFAASSTLIFSFIHILQLPPPKPTVFLIRHDHDIAYTRRHIADISPPTSMQSSHACAWLARSRVWMSLGCALLYTWYTVCMSFGDGADAGVRMEFA